MNQMATKKPVESTDLVEIKGALAVPDFMNEFRGQALGAEDVEKTDLSMPRIALAQDLSPYKKKNDPRFIPELESGEYFNTVSGVIYGKKVYFVPVKFGKSRMLCHPMNEGGGIICQSLNGKTGGKLSPESCETCSHALWDEGKPDCGLLFNFLGYVFTELPGPNEEIDPSGLDAAVLTFKSTSLKYAKQLNSMIRMANLPSFAKVYELNAVDETKNNNTYAQHKIKPFGFVTKSLFAAGKDLYESMKDKDIKVDDVDDGEGTGTGADDFNTQEM
jgi:hypothetical protein